MVRVLLFYFGFINTIASDVKKQALYCVCNIATGKESLKTQILNSALPQHLLAFLVCRKYQTKLIIQTKKIAVSLKL